MLLICFNAGGGRYKEANKDVTKSTISAEIGREKIDWYCEEKGRRMLTKLHRTR